MADTVTPPNYDTQQNTTIRVHTNGFKPRIGLSNPIDLFNALTLTYNQDGNGCHHSVGISNRFALSHAHKVVTSRSKLPAKPAPAESIQQSTYLSGSQSADPAPPGCQSAKICPQHEPSRTSSPTPSPQ
nr:hypothetical protein [Tanacetum cinerariifolium]